MHLGGTVLMETLLFSHYRNSPPVSDKRIQMIKIHQQSLRYLLTDLLHMFNVSPNNSVAGLAYVEERYLGASSAIREHHQNIESCIKEV